MNENFMCLDCGKNFYEPNYSLTVSHGEIIYKTRTGLLHCPECSGTNLEFIEKPGKYDVNFGKFASSDDATKKQMLRKRSEEHFNKKLKDNKVEQDRKLVRKFKEGM